MARQTEEQKETIERVMHEYKHGELETPQGHKVRKQKQAVAIALREAGVSRATESRDAGKGRKHERD